MPKSAHRKSRRAYIHKSEFKLISFFYIFFAFVFLVSLFFIFFGGYEWNGKDKLIIGINTSGFYKITILDPKNNEITNLNIPGDTEMNLSRNLGTLRLKNVWNFGKNEGQAGDIYVKTLSKSFSVPIYLYSDANLNDFTKFVLGRGLSNIGFIDRLKIYFFIKSVKDVLTNDIDLAKSQFVKNEKLTDGEMGYKIYDNLFIRLLIYFDSSFFSDNNIKIYIKDSTGKYSVAQNVGKVLENWGGKIVVIDRLEQKDFDCFVSGNNKKAMEMVSKIYSCKIEKGEDDNDIYLRLGKKFADKY